MPNVHDDTREFIDLLSRSTEVVDRFIPRAQAARDFGVSTKTLDNRVANGKMKPAHKIHPGLSATKGWSERYLCDVYQKQIIAQYGHPFVVEAMDHPYGFANEVVKIDPHTLIDVKSTAYHMSTSKKTIWQWTKAGFFPKADENDMRPFWLVMMVVRGDDWQSAIAKNL